MAETPLPLVLDFVEWIGKAPRPYAEAIEAWRTSCPRLTVWEEAFERGYVTRVSRPDGAAVMTTALGERLLHEHGRSLHGADHERRRDLVSRA
jgi:hypothetical protein